MERDRRLARAGDTLDDEGVGVGVPDDRVLVALDRSDDVLHPLVGRAVQLVLQHVVDDVQAEFQHQFHAAFADAELALQLEPTVHFAGRRQVSSRPRLVVVED